ncbi:unnamed protein product [Rotaria sp. Silwood2]|nr:unnamed protein product [Rotaria sp. Silwood2]CAF3991185.1 unnamed protein product [Rotaria sp. Silwood2]
MATVDSFRTLLLARFLLGTFQCGFFPGFIYYISLWYRRKEQAIRLGFFWSFSALAGAFGGLFAYGIAQIKSSKLAEWQLIFIIEGIPTIILAILCWFYLPDSPEQARFLNGKQRQLEIDRLIQDAGISHHDSFSWSQVLSVFTDWKTYIYAMIYICGTTSLQGITLVLPTLIHEMDQWTPIQTQLMAIPPYLVAFISILIVSHSSDYFVERSFHLVFTNLLTILGFLILIFVEPQHVCILYVGVVFVTSGLFSNVSVKVAWINNNFASLTRRAVALALIISIAALGGIISGQIYQAKDKPRYLTGNTVALSFIVLQTILIVILRLVFLYINHQRSRMNNEQINQQIERYGGNELVGDRHPQFRYTLSAQLTITLANEGLEAYKPELYGEEIQIIRRIGSRQSGYKILGANRKVISTRKETIDEIIQALSISPENPLCVLHQEIAKTFLISSDSRKKYQFYMKASQLNQIKQAYEQSVCTVQLLTQRVNTMKEKHVDMLRELEPLEQEVKKIELRRDYQEKRHVLEAELISARADQARQQLFEVQYELDQIKKTKDDIGAQIIDANKKILEIDQRLENYSIEKSDFEKDTNGLNELLSHFSKQKQDIQYRIHSLTQDCENYRKILTDVELEQIYLQKQIDKYENLSHQSDDNEQQRLKIDQEISDRQEKQIEWDKIIMSLTEDIRINDENIRDKQITIDFLTNELKQKQQNLDELIKLDQDKTNVYGKWMPDCLKRIQKDQRFHKKPIGPIGLHIHCIDSHWSYAVEKHLAPIMSSFICTDNHDEKILLEILSSYSFDRRPPVYIRAHTTKVHDVSGTLKHIKQANLLSIYDVLKIDNITVECALIDFKQIEATILLENLEEVKQLRQSETLHWEKIDRKVKQVVEAWTSDGSNIKFDKTFRIYTNDKQSIKYFFTHNIESLSIDELENDIKRPHSQIQEMNTSINELKTIRKTKMDEINQTKRASTNNKKKIKELMKVIQDKRK